MNAFAGTGTLIRFILRRDRVRLPVWIVAIVGLMLSTAASYLSGEIFGTDQDLAIRIEMITTNPIGIIFTGPAHGYEAVSLDNMGPMVANEMSAMTLIIVAVMSILLVVRHTRTEEESGRSELVRAAVVGPLAMPLAVLIVLAAANTVLAILLGLGLMAFELPAAGSFAFGASVASIGIVFAAVAVLTAQLAEFGRAAIGLALTVLGVSFGVRAVGDMGDGTLSWLSPFGWAQALRPYAGEEWWPLLPSLALAAIVSMAAFAIIRRRDVGAGLIRPRPGPATASARLSRPIGLAARLQRGGLVVWTIVLVVLGLTMAGVATQADALAELEIYTRMFASGTDIVEGIFGTYLLFMAMLAVAYALLAAGHLRGEETSGRAEPVLATATSRVGWMASHLVVVAAGVVVVLGAGGFAAGLLHALNVGDAGELPRIFAASFVWVPATWLFVGFAAALFGLWPRGLVVTWLIFAYAALAGMFAPILGLPEWIDRASPLGHTPLVPAVELEVLPLVVMTVLAAGLMAAGLVGFARRDIHSPA